MNGRERALLQAFVGHLAANGSPGLIIDRWPDEENRIASDIDAVAGRFAIEHTTVDACPGQRENESRLRKILGGLPDECAAVLGCRLRILLEYDAVRPGQDWGAIRRHIKTWILQSTLDLPLGQHLLRSVPGIPFPLRVKKALGRPAVVFGVMQPEDVRLAERLRAQLDRKAKKLAPYKVAGQSTILLVESSDISLMSECILGEAVVEAFGEPTPPEVDALWYADTCVPDAEPVFLDLTRESA